MILLWLAWYGTASETKFMCKVTVRNDIRMEVHFLLNYMYWMKDVACAWLT